MKRLILLALALIASNGLQAQQLGFSSFSSLGNVHANEQETYHHAAGEPINERRDITYYSMLQGVMQGSVEPQSSLARIQVRFFLDENEDGRKNFNENYVESGSFKIDSNRYSIFKSDGVIFDAPLGSYEIEFDFYKKHFILTTDAIVDVDVSDPRDYVAVNFGLKPDTECVEPDIKMASDRFRCFDQVTYRICVMNNGCVPYTDTIFLEIDNRLDPDSIFFVDTPDVVLGDHEVGWVLEVKPGKTTILNYGVAAPQVDDPDDLGEIYKSRAWVTLESGESAEECFEQELRCSYDPNDKLVSPDREDNLALIDDHLYYTIRFQNTGNDYAEDVLVIDTISSNLDLSSLNLLYTSHPRELEIRFPENDLNIVHFRFDKIFLPDSTTNEPGSNGQVMFSIAAVEGLELESEIENTAHIYFDRNPAIVTNTVKSIMVNEFPIVATTDIENQLDISIYPNPSSGMLFLSGRVEQLQVFDVAGRLLMTEQKVNEVDCSILDSGFYLIELSNQGQEKIQKIELITRN